MMIDIVFAVLHNPLFLSGCNLKDRLDANPKSGKLGLKLQYDTEKKWLVVSYNGKACFVPESNLASVEPVNAKDIGVDLTKVLTAPPQQATFPNAKPMVAGIQSAQVETPHSKPPTPPNRIAKSV